LLKGAVLAMTAVYVISVILFIISTALYLWVTKKAYSRRWEDE